MGTWEMSHGHDSSNPLHAMQLLQLGNNIRQHAFNILLSHTECTRDESPIIGMSFSQPGCTLTVNNLLDKAYPFLLQLL